MEGMPENDHRRTAEFPKAASYTLEAEFPDPGSQQSTPERDFSEAATSSSKVIPCFRVGLEQWQTRKPGSNRRKWKRRERLAGLSSVLRDADKSRNDGRKPRMRGEGISPLHFRGQTVLLVLANFP